MSKLKATQQIKQEYKSYRAEQIYNQYQEVKKIKVERGNDISPDTKTTTEKGGIYNVSLGY